ncbi:MAG: hypothetical protein LBV27_06835 [Oscillospiraceae bacterium]|jgi:hypothetical protein|nr:hypothetical protein [Oscillospiraceae bacterium]
MFQSPNRRVEDDLARIRSANLPPRPAPAQALDAETPKPLATGDVWAAIMALASILIPYILVCVAVFTVVFLMIRMLV